MRHARSVVFVVLVLAATAVVTACATDRPGWTYAPAPSATPVPSVEPTDGVTPEPSSDGSIVKVSAANILFDQKALEVPAGVAFKIEFANNDAGVPHNVAIHEGTATGPELFKGDIFNGVETRTYDAPALTAGAYAFVCTVHPTTMIIDVTAR
jgi:plastocyanin